jgi:hypothetical protein
MLASQILITERFSALWGAWTTPCGSDIISLKKRKLKTNEENSGSLKEEALVIMDTRLMLESSAYYCTVEYAFSLVKPGQNFCVHGVLQ